MPGSPAWLLLLCCCIFQDLRRISANFRSCWNPQEKDHSSTLQLPLHQLPSLLTAFATACLPLRLGLSYGTFSLAQYVPAVIVSPPCASNKSALSPSLGFSPHILKAPLPVAHMSIYCCFDVLQNDQQPLLSFVVSHETSIIMSHYNNIITSHCNNSSYHFLSCIKILAWQI